MIINIYFLYSISARRVKSLSYSLLCCLVYILASFLWGRLAGRWLQLAWRRMHYLCSYCPLDTGYTTKTKHQSDIQTYYNWRRIGEMSPFLNSQNYTPLWFIDVYNTHIDIYYQYYNTYQMVALMDTVTESSSYITLRSSSKPNSIELPSTSIAYKTENKCTEITIYKCSISFGNIYSNYTLISWQGTVEI